MVIDRVSAKFRCKACGREFTLKQDKPFLAYLAKEDQVPVRCPTCGTDRISEFLGRID